MIPENADKLGRQLVSPWHKETEFRDNELLRSHMAALIPELGELVKRHAAEMGTESGQDCAFQVDGFGKVLVWQICEYLMQSGCEGEYWESALGLYELGKHHAEDFFEWPPTLE